MNILSERLMARDSDLRRPYVIRKAAVLCRFFNRSACARNPGLPGLSLLAVLIFSGCQSLRPVTDLNRYYVLSATVAAPLASKSNQHFAIGVAPVEIPAYLQNSRIAVRRGTNEIHYSEYRQWAEHLDKGVQRVLALDLATLMPGSRTITSAWQGGEVQAELYLTVEQFELNENGAATLECQWRIVTPDKGHAIQSSHFSVTKKGPALADNPSVAVNTLSEAVAELSGKIASAFPTL